MKSTVGSNALWDIVGCVLLHAAFQVFLVHFSLHCFECCVLLKSTRSLFDF